MLPNNMLPATVYMSEEIEDNAGVTVDNAGVTVDNAGVTEVDYTQLSVKELNKWIREQGWTDEQARSIKRARRRAKNREYARASRARRRAKKASVPPASSAS